MVKMPTQKLAALKLKVIKKPI
jgi:hypothetical protein